MNEINFEKGGGLVPAIIQDALTGNVLMLGYMNEESYQMTIQSGKVTFYSRSKERIWLKGETSGCFLEWDNIKVDCDGDALLITAKPGGPVCHTGADTCWGEPNLTKYGFLSALEQKITERKNDYKADSYVSRLFRSGLNKIAQKVGEEAIEVVIEAKDNDDTLFLNESADLLFHFLILLQAKGKSLEQVVEVLRSRERQS